MELIIYFSYKNTIKFKDYFSYKMDDHLIPSGVRNVYNVKINDEYLQIIIG